jgi:hypothetical protein
MALYTLNLKNTAEMHFIKIQLYPYLIKRRKEAEHFIKVQLFFLSLLVKSNTLHQGTAISWQGTAKRKNIKMYEYEPEQYLIPVQQT